MARSFWQLTVREGFSSAHALRNYQGKCENMHGHNYLAELVVEGDTLTEDTELVADFTVLKKILREELQKLDHCVLNETPPFDKINPSSENIARYLWKCIEPRLKEFPVRLYSVSKISVCAFDNNERVFAQPYGSVKNAYNIELFIMYGN